MSKIAIIKTGGKQYKVKEKDIIKVEKLDTEEGKSITFDQVLLVADEKGADVQIGTPTLSTKVTAKVLEQGRAKKIDVVKYKSKTRYHKKYGHRQPFTKVEIEKIA